jgi:transcriptional regulator with XRE-family HTH domain
MKEINIARAIINKRREKGLTQDDLASYIGVSKASVSKWETGQSYPDITFLPQLAAFFNISMDELMGYEPQMSKEDIRKLYLSLSSDFTVKPFDEVLKRCREIAKKYFSCFPLRNNKGKNGPCRVNHRSGTGAETEIFQGAG